MGFDVSQEAKLQTGWLLLLLRLVLINKRFMSYQGHMLLVWVKISQRSLVPYLLWSSLCSLYNRKHPVTL